MKIRLSSGFLIALLASTAYANIPIVSVANETDKTFDKVTVKFKFIGDNDSQAHHYKKRGYADGSVTIHQIAPGTTAFLNAADATKGRVSGYVIDHFTHIEDVRVIGISAKMDNELQHAKRRYARRGTRATAFVVRAKKGWHDVLLFTITPLKKARTGSSNPSTPSTSSG